MNNMLIPDASDSFNHQYHLEQYSHLPNDPNPWKKPYWYRTLFAVSAADKDKEFQLIFKGINYRAEVWLNGKLIADSSQMAGMFAEYYLNVTKAINTGGENALAVKIYPLDFPGLPSHPQLDALGDFYPNGGPTGDIGKNVTMLCSIGWDWIPEVRDRNIGIWQPVYLRTTGQVTISKPQVITELPSLPDTGIAKISLHLNLSNNSEVDLHGKLKIIISPENFAGQPVTFSKDVSVGLDGFKLEEIASALGGNSDWRKIAFMEDFPVSCPDRELAEWAGALNLKSCWSAPVVDARGQLLGVIVVFSRDLRQLTTQDHNRLEMAAGMASIAIEHRRLTDRLSYQAQHDALTGLPNRFLLGDRLEQAIAYANRHRSGLAVLLLDLDGFKYINDSLGHQAGDQVLVEVSRRLRSVTRQVDTVARIGGDEFCLVSSDVRNADDALKIAQTCLDVLRKPILIAERDYAVSASIGISCYPEHGEEPELLQQHADTAMYHAKFNGKNGFQVFTPEINAHLRQRIELMADLRQALDNGEFRLEYQPQFLAAGELVGFEALLRWDHPERGTIPPTTFIPIAEETGLVVPIGKWVLDQACRQLAAWRVAGYENLRMSVNVSTLQFERQDWIETISGALKSSGLPPSALELELTETVVMKNCERAAERLAQLRALGISSAIDDFGTGYSSLKYLQSLPIDTLKIDQSFVRNLDPLSNGESGNGAIVRAIVTLAQQLGLRVVAEGVETNEELALLRRLGCDLVQGYLFAKPMRVEACDLFLRESYSSSPSRGKCQLRGPRRQTWSWLCL